MSEPEERPFLGDGRAVLFPEIIIVAIIAIYAPYYLFQMASAGHVAWAVVGFLGWLIGIITTFFCLKRRMYFLAFLPMLLIMGVGVIIDLTLFPK